MGLVLSLLPQVSRASMFLRVARRNMFLVIDFNLLCDPEVFYVTISMLRRMHPRPSPFSFSRSDEATLCLVGGASGDPGNGG